MRFAPALFAVLGLSLSGGAAQAAVEVIGDGPARLCFLAANSDHVTVLDVGVCTKALGTDLSRRDRAATFINRGVIELLRKDYDAAVDDFDAGIRTKPEMGEGYLNRGATRIAQHLFAQARDDIDRGLTLGVSKPSIGYYDRAIANEALGDARAAYDDYRQAVALDPDFVKASDQLKRFKLVEKPGT